MFTFLKNANHEECVYNLIENPTTRPTPQPMYRSRFSCAVRRENYCNKIGCSRTMGVPKVGLCPPQNYLKKNSRAPISIYPFAVPKVRVLVESKPKMEQKEKDEECYETKEETETTLGLDPVVETNPCCKEAFVVCKESVSRLCCNVKKPPVPPYFQPLEIIPRGPKNFVRDNAVRVVRQPAKIPEARFVDTPNGHTQDWCTSGYPRKYVCRDDFGEVPAYIIQRKQELCEKEKEISAALRKPDIDAANACRHMSCEERDSLITDLKNSWHETYLNFQALPLLIDTPGKIKRKTDLEQALIALEKDIQLIERHNNIFLADTDKSFYLA